MIRCFMAILLTFTLCSLANAVCIKNQTDFSLHYKIDNKNLRYPIPKVRHYEGTIEAKTKKCFAHSRSDGNEWQIYRKDIITIDKIGSSGLITVCKKNVNGILNTLDVDYHAWSDKWWCLDNSDYEE